MSATTLVTRLQQLAQLSPGLELYRFLKDGVQVSETLTCAELDRRARRIALQLRDSLTEGDRVLLIESSGLDFIAALFGCFYARLIAVPFPKPRALAHDDDWTSIRRIAADCNPALILTDSQALEPLWATHGDPAIPISLTPDVADANADADFNVPLGRPDADEVAFLQYTSGSTGDPKGAVITHGNVVSNLAAMENSFLSVFTVGVSWLPMHHDMGLIGAVFSAVWMGSPLYVMSPFSMLKQPFHWLSAISRYRATISPAPNFAFDYCVERITEAQKRELDLSCWKVACVGAEPVQARTLERFYEAFRCCGFRWESFYPCYGLAEATLFVSGGRQNAPPVIRSFRTEPASGGREPAVALSSSLTLDPGKPASRLVGCGQPGDGFQVLVVDPVSSVPQADGEIGELWIQGDSVARDYWNSPLESAEVFSARLAENSAGPFLRTGDLGFFDAGELFITGRLKDVVLIRGQNHFPTDIERTVAGAHPALANKLSAAVGHVIDGEEQLVIIQELERRVLSECPSIRDAVQQALFDRHGLKAVDICFVRTGTLPRTTSGKIRRRECQARYGQGTLEVLEEHV